MYVTEQQLYERLSVDCCDNCLHLRTNIRPTHESLVLLYDLMLEKKRKEKKRKERIMLRKKEEKKKNC